MGVLEARGIYGRGIYGVWLGVYINMQIGVYMVGVYTVFLEGYIWGIEGETPRLTPPPITVTATVFRKNRYQFDSPVTFFGINIMF